MRTLRKISITLAIFACILYTTNSQPFGSAFNRYRDYDDVDAYPVFNPFIIGRRPVRQQQRPSGKQRDGIQFPSSSFPQPESPVVLGSRPLNQQRPFQQQQQGNFQQGNFQQPGGQFGNNVPSWAQQGSGNVPQQPQAGGNPPRPQQGGSGCSCSSTEEYNPVCGSDNTTYSNPGRVMCASRCGNPITILYHGNCRASAGPRG